MIKLKILVIGPCESGKTTIANLLAEATENAGGDYHPTQALRILEFERSNLNVNNIQMSAEIELWDCSGNRRFEPCWPAIQQDTQGVIFVYNPSSLEHHRDLELLYNYFVTQLNLSPKLCLLIAYQKHAADKDLKNIQKLTNTLARIKHVLVNIEESTNKLQAEFNTFVEVLLGQASSRNDQEELNIINTQSAY